ncbi:hypothetical protein P3X46_009428 [Hevea brasiliensis]|uniref:Nuclear transcription factor Y subunit n=1 Tax=Hevea brasiliensis TaxID=3981 RepID=A0ABQ9MQW9_HEVBR|nr:nuclear transcription factor Y subunit A-10 [Hevea brasiliensis]XP_058003341.1 nuclear transcription factor Y subunit A-10 [Hevea brasiliensis]XP_058003342.1 nuclear transcription factor Y subunit A-10 [Hevea brasiliensis]KAJ9181284.1 hypothetical protein P3X46_009428 [Hevea brasiliensis]KAJ9181285.1 hypothetical protein P3X46_009428 [Hevea brasiliensis]
MAVKTLYFKEHEGIVHNPIGQLSSVPSVPWWSTFGSQSVYGESCGLVKASSIEQSSTGGDQLTAIKQASRCTEKGLDKGNTTQFTIFPGDCKTSDEGQKSPQTAISLQTTLPEYRSHIDLGFGQPMICAKYPHMDHCYGVFSTYGPQISGRIMLPMNMTTDDGPIFVNPKQYHGIIRRRKTRAKAVLLENKSTRKRKPYMHLSRHLHAMRRPRGTGGRFLNTQTSKNGIHEIEAKKATGGKIFQPTGSQSSEVLQSDSGTLNSSKEANGGGSNLSGSEVTSMYTRRDLDHCSLNRLTSQVQSFSIMMDSGHSIVMPSKWVAAADNCCNLKV